MSRRELKERRSDLAQWLISLEKVKKMRTKLQPSTYDYLMQDYINYSNEIAEINVMLKSY